MSNKKLLPVIPNIAACEYCKWDYDVEHKATIKYLKEYSKYLENALLWEMDPNLISRLQSETGHGIIPSISLSPNPLGSHHPPYPPFGEPAKFPFTLTNELSKYIDWIEKHQNEFNRIFICDQLCETFGYPGIEISAILNNLYEFLPWAKAKFACSIISHRLYLDFLNIKSGLQTFVEQANPLMLIYEGVRLTNAKGWDTVNLHRYLTSKRDSLFFSGIEFTSGARNHNLNKLIEFGFDGCLFYLPTVISKESDKDMEDYLTDIILS